MTALDWHQQRAARQRLAACITALLRRQPFFGAVALNLTPPSADPSRPTMATDGAVLYYNPVWVHETQTEKLIQALAHLVLACALKHHTRRENRTYARWQKASRLVTQYLLLEEKLADPRQGPGLDLSIAQAYDTLPEDPEDEEPAGPRPAPSLDLSVPQAHSTLPEGQEEEKPAGPRPGPSPEPSMPQDYGARPEGQKEATPEPKTPKPDAGSGGTPPDGEQTENGQDPPNEKRNGAGPNGGRFQDPQGHGEVLDSPSGKTEELRQEEMRWDHAIHQALQIAKSRGWQTAGVRRLVESSHNPLLDWREALKAFIAENLEEERSWNVPDRRMIHSGLFLPGLSSPGFQELCFAVDTSGSMSQEEMNLVWSQIQDCAAQMEAERIRVIQCDAEVKEDHTYHRTDLPSTLETMGGGGTKFTPVFEALEDEPPKLLLYMTDLQSNDFPENPPEYGVCWICTSPRNPAQPPFGTRIDLPERL